MYVILPSLTEHHLGEQELKLDSTVLVVVCEVLWAVKTAVRTTVSVVIMAKVINKLGN